MNTIYDELCEALALLDNTTAVTDQDAERVGLAELAIKRALDMCGSPAASYHIVCDDTGIALARSRPANPAQARAVIHREEDTGDGRSKWTWMRLRDGTLMLGIFPQGNTYMEFSDAGVCDFWA